jgi:hypothetical protein
MDLTRPKARIKVQGTRKKYLTAEIAEHAELKMAKSSALGKKGPHFPRFPKGQKPPTGFPGKISALSASSSVIFLS